MKSSRIHAHTSSPHWLSHAARDIRAEVECRGPGIRDADRRRSGSFSRLIAHIEESPEALDALVYAYAELPSEARSGLIRVTVQDAADPSIPLTAFLAVEEEPAIQLQLRGLLAKHGHVARCAWSWGTRSDGGAALTQTLGELAPDTLEIHWKDHKINEIRVEASALISFPHDAQRRPPAEVVELITPRLWTYLRDGHPMPEGADRFVGFFSLR